MKGFGLKTENVTFSVEYRATFWDFRENIDNAAVRAALPDLETNNDTVRGALTFLFHQSQGETP